ncbi:metallophosphoesterase family protein [Snuella sedimenti]|uniref:Metallophosphoesterase n=1 Tax=Snuella sedimenti TaxID=2798802 RepID=A0A8J7IHD1_9FLAO|nr:metallophosphoesterase [Snuella sedimenti]MBJ6368328.1 metallophosphoesterase [Snuella sedimenti]
MSVYKYIVIAFITLLLSIRTNAQEIDNPYNPEPKMKALKTKTGKHVATMHFLVFGDSKGSRHFPNVLKRADSLQPDFCITTADLVNTGGGKKGKQDYDKLDKMGGWFMRKYPMWPTVGNHEESGGDDGVENFTNFFGMKKAMYSFEYGNAKFIALPWPKINNDRVKLKWLKKELRNAKGKHIFIFKHRPHYTLGAKSYKDVEGKETKTTKLYDRYNVTAVFSGHDHIYYRTKRNTTNYIISAGAGATIYPLRRENDALKNDAYYGKRTDENIKKGHAPYMFRAANGTITNLPEAMYYVLSVKIDGDRVSIEMIDEKTGKVWDRALIK